MLPCCIFSYRLRWKKQTSICATCTSKRQMELTLKSHAGAEMSEQCCPLPRILKQINDSTNQYTAASMGWAPFAFFPSLSMVRIYIHGQWWCWGCAPSPSQCKLSTASGRGHLHTQAWELPIRPPTFKLGKWVQVTSLKLCPYFSIPLTFRNSYTNHDLDDYGPEWLIFPPQ